MNALTTLLQRHPLIFLHLVTALAALVLGVLLALPAGAAVTVVAFALIFFTLVEPLGEKLQYVNLALGLVCLLTGTGLGLFYELLR